ncbi:MAG: acetylxylan esterase [Ruminococcaceae bacterium]|nr:acetylxylan esterase [Oscillospiraceae bacterium]
MPLIDMPLDKLKVYQGRNPRPADFDEFWDRSLEEMRAIDPKAEFKPYDYPSKVADFFELRFKSTKNATIYAKFARPKNIEGKIPAVLSFHGLSASGLPWNALISYVSQGFCIATLDCRGQGGLSQDVGGVPGTTHSTPFMRGMDGEPEDLLCRDLFLDTAMLARVIMGLDYVDEKRVGVFGGSQGGALSIACAALVPEIKLCAPTYPYLSDYKRVWDMDLDRGAYEGLRYYFRNFDPTHARENEIFEKLGYIDIQFLAPRIKAKVMMQTGLMDNTCPPSTQFAAFNKIESEKEVVIYPDYGHEGIKGEADRTFAFLSQL